MKILILVPSLASYPFLRDMCFDLAAAGHSVHVAAGWNSLGRFQADEEVINFHSIDFPRGMNPVAHIRAMHQLNRLVQKIKPELIDVHFSAAAFTAALARRNYWPPTIATVQGLRFPLATGMQKHILKHAECWSARRIDMMIVLTDDDLNALKDAGVRNRHKQLAYGFGCDLSKYDSTVFSEEEKRRIAKEIGKSDGDIVFSFVGRFVEFKGFHLVVQAFLEATFACPNIKLLLCGDFDEYHASGLTNTELSDIKGHKQAVFTGWTDEVGKYLSITDVVVFPSEREGVPVILMEALSMGIPVITCDSRGCREVMNEGRNGIVLKSRTVKELASSMTRMSQDAQLREQYSKSALEFRSNFDRQAFSSEHIALLEDIYSGKLSVFDK